MCYEGDNCKTGDLILDHKAGVYVCTKCGQVKDQFFTPEKNEGRAMPLSNKMIETIKDMLDRIHVPTCYAEEIAQYHQRNYNLTKLKTLILSIYFILNKHSFNIPLSHLLQTNGLTGTRIFHMQKPNKSVLIDAAELLDRFYMAIGLTYKDMSLIKEQIKSLPPSGHTPLTILAGNIYLYCKANNKKISIRQISNITQVSYISIQRYIKKK